MDNLFFDIKAEGRDALTAALDIAWSGFPGAFATHYAEIERDGRNTLVLLWHVDNGATKLPYPISKEQAAGFIEGWLAGQESGPKPDHDGDNSPGFRMFVDDWRNVEGFTYSILGVQFAWAIYGK
jgi:hypothetical protein